MFQTLLARVHNNNFEANNSQDGACNGSEMAVHDWRLGYTKEKACNRCVYCFYKWTLNDLHDYV